MAETPWKIEWSDALSMQNAEIDAQHRHFIALVNELNGAIIDRADKPAVERIMKLILEDAIDHFAFEERLFVEKNYPLAQQHRQRHAELISTIRQLLQQMQQTGSSLRWIEMGLAIKDALVGHALEEDALYIDSLRTV